MRFAQSRDHLRLRPPSCGAEPAPAVWRRRELVDHDLRYVYPRCLELTYTVRRLREGQGLRHEHPDEGAAGFVPEERPQRAGAGCDLLDQRVGRVATIAAPEAAGEKTVLRLHGVEKPGQTGEEVGRAQETQGVAGGCGVDDDFVVGVRVREPLQLQEADELVHPGEGQVEQVLRFVQIEEGAPRGHRGQQGSALAQPAGEGAVGVHLHRVETAGHTPGAGAEIRSRTSPREWAGSVETTRVRRPEAAEATAQAAAQVVLPTPPLPAK